LLILSKFLSDLASTYFRNFSLRIRAYRSRLSLSASHRTRQLGNQRGRRRLGWLPKLHSPRRSYRHGQHLQPSIFSRRANTHIVNAPIVDAKMVSLCDFIFALLWPAGQQHLKCLRAPSFILLVRQTTNVAIHDTPQTASATSCKQAPELGATHSSRHPSRASRSHRTTPNHSQLQKMTREECWLTFCTIKWQSCVMPGHCLPNSTCLTTLRRPSQPTR
jgi:hypothetical protein